jgi:hypothetical protein
MQWGVEGPTVPDPVSTNFSEWLGAVLSSWKQNTALDPWYELAASPLLCPSLLVHAANKHWRCACTADMRLSMPGQHAPAGRLHLPKSLPWSGSNNIEKGTVFGKERDTISVTVHVAPVPCCARTGGRPMRHACRMQTIPTHSWLMPHASQMQNKPVHPRSQS